jgi:hypothetical protein
MKFTRRKLKCAQLSYEAYVRTMPEGKAHQDDEEGDGYPTWDELEDQYRAFWVKQSIPLLEYGFVHGCNHATQTLLAMCDDETGQADENLLEVFLAELNEDLDRVGD